MNTVIPIEGEPARFFVGSESGEPDYLVDIDEFNGFGQCDCLHFQCKIAPKLDKHDPAKPCKHIVAVRNHIKQQATQ